MIGFDLLLPKVARYDGHRISATGRRVGQGLPVSAMGHASR